MPREALPEQQPAVRDERQFLRPNEPKMEQARLPKIREDEDGVTVYQGKTIEAMERQMVETNNVLGLAQLRAATKFSSLAQQANGLALVVGGAVRDELFGKSPKDVDIECYKISPEEVERLAGELGEVNAVGKAFGIIKVKTEDGAELDISLPRTDSKVGEGHRGFEVKTDPAMSIRDAAKRRDFTWNAMSKNLLTGEIYDPFHGAQDAYNRILRVTDRERFQDDPLRVLRAAQFIGRLGLEVDPDSDNLMREMIPRLRECSPDRFLEEWKKLLLKSPKPSLGLQTLMEWGVIREFYPELADIRKLPQEAEWHPEGDVWIHTLMVVDAAKTIARRERMDHENEFELLLASLCHDLGKASTTDVEEKDGELRITSIGHETESGELARVFLEKLGTPKRTVEKVEALVKNHMVPGALYRQMLLAQREGKPVSFAKAIRHLAGRIDPATIEMLTYVAEADFLGRGPFPDPEMPNQFLLLFGDKSGAWLRRESRAIGVANEKPKPSISGKELITFGILSPKDGRVFGDVIRAADRVRDDLGWDGNAILAELHLMKSEGLDVRTMIERLLALTEPEQSAT